MAIKHKYTIMCDEVRREDNGKFMILGMYNEAIGLPQIPFVMPALTFFQYLESDRPGMFHFKMRIEHLESGSRLVEGGGQLMFPKPGLGLNHMRLGNLVLTNPGMYNFVIEIEGQQNEPIIFPFNVILNAVLQGQMQMPQMGR